MKKLLLLIMVGLTTLSANSGEDIYKAKCSMCHSNKGMISASERKSMMEEMQTPSKEERMAMREKMKKKMQEENMMAPPMPMVSLRLKSKLKTKKEFIAFVEDYIQNPSQEKGFCMPRAYERFGTMPPIGKGMSTEERATIASWLYDNYKGSWDKSCEARNCELRNQQSRKETKCGAAKCGGSVKIPTH